MLPFAPAMFSTMTGCPSVARIRSARIRPTTSTLPPGGNGMIIVIGRDGYVCAVAGQMSAGAARTAPPSCRNSRRGSFITCLQVLVADKHFRGGVDDRCAAQVAHLVLGIERRGAVHGTAVVPDDQVADLPLVAIDELRLRRKFHKLVEQRLTFLDRHAYDVRCMRGDIERVAS